MNEAAFYKHSGRVSVLGLLMGAVTAAVVGPILALIYAVAIAYIPFIYLNAILTCLFGGGVGFAIAMAMKLGKVRNTYVVVLGAFLGVGFAHYVGWMAWIGVLFFRSDIDVPVLAILMPWSFVALVLDIAREGVWTIGSGGNPVSGIMLWLVWFIEAGLVFGCALVAAVVTSSAEPFCESCQSWCEGRNGLLRLTGYADGHALTQRLQSLDLNALAETSRADPSETTWHEIDLSTCPKCGTTNTLSLSFVTLSYDKKGNAETKKDLLIDRLLVDREQAGWIADTATGAGPALSAGVGAIAP